MDKPRIVIVDDDPSLSAFVVAVLAQTGRYAVCAENRSSRAITTIREYQPDLILLDVEMPGMTGGDVLMRLKEDPKLREIPVVFLTATVKKSEIEKRGNLISGFPFLGKPANGHEIRTCVDSILGKRAADEAGGVRAV